MAAMKIRNLGIIVLAAVQASCGSAEEELESETRPTANQPPGGGSSPGDRGGEESRQWLGAAEQVHFCDFPECPGSDGFSVANDGTYFVGDPRAPRSTGQLTEAERSSFVSAVNAVAAQDLDSEPTCTTRTEPVYGLTTYTDVLVFEDETAVVVAKVTQEEDCFNGSREAAEALRAQFDQLERKYDARDAGSAPSSGP
jgi:hypothetical protein